MSTTPTPAIRTLAEARADRITLDHPDEPEWLVLIEHTFAYRVTAATPDEAAAIADEGVDLDHQNVECLFSTVERVVAGDGSWFDDDLRGEA